MSILFRNSEGWLLDQSSYVNKCYHRCLGLGEAEQKRYLKCCFKKHYFEITKPHIILRPDATADGSTCRHIENVGNETVSECQWEDKYLKKTADKKKRKRKHKELNQGDVDAQVHHEKVRPIILEGTPGIVAEGRTCGFFYHAENNGKLHVPIDDSRLAELCDMAKQLPPVDDSQLKHVQTIDGDRSHMEQLDLFTWLSENPLHHAREVLLMGERYLLPPNSCFLLSDVTRMHPLVNYGKKFEAIVLDPPWENKSVKRSNRYSFLPSSQLKQLPVPHLSAFGCVVATWVTNRQKHLRFVREELYPHWGVEVLAEWIWVKVTRAGEFVFPLDSPHKKPYEMLVLGRFRGHAEEEFSSPTVSEEPALPEHRLIVSIPSVLHSHKPSISEVLKEYLGPDPGCLELFARNLQPGWTSWGNEVLKFQHLSYFDVEPASCNSSPSAEPATGVVSETTCLGLRNQV